MDLNAPAIPILETIVKAQQLVGAAISRIHHLAAVSLCSQQVTGLGTKLNLHEFGNIDAHVLRQHDVIEIDKAVSFRRAVRIIISMPRIDNLGPRAQYGSRWRGEEDAEMIPGPGARIDLRRIRHIRKIESGLDSEADGSAWLLMGRILRHRPLLAVKE